MQDMDQSLTAEEHEYAFGQGPMKPFVNGARFFCLAFAFITPNLLLLSHVWGN